MGLWEGDVNQEDLPGILSPANEGPECSSTPRKVPCDTPGGFCWLLNDMTMLLMTSPSPQKSQPFNLPTVVWYVVLCIPLFSSRLCSNTLFLLVCFIKMGTSDKHSYARLGGPSLPYLSIDSFFWTLKHMSWMDVLRFIELFTCWWAFMLHSTTTALVHLSMYFFKTKSKSRRVSWKGKCQWPRHGRTSRALLSHTLTLPLCGHHLMVPWVLFCEIWGEGSWWVRTFCVSGSEHLEFYVHLTLWSKNNYYPHLLCNSMDCSLPGSSVHGILQARILEWVAMPSSRESTQGWTHISCISCPGWWGS